MVKSLKLEDICEKFVGGVVVGFFLEILFQVALGLQDKELDTVLHLFELKLLLFEFLIERGQQLFDF